MKIKIVVPLLVLSVVLLSGCLGNQQHSPGNNTTPAENVTSGDNTTPVENVTFGNNTTPVENVTSGNNTTPVENVTSEKNITQGVNETPEVNVTSTTGASSSIYSVRLDNYRATPSSLQIKTGDKVSWINLQDNPKRKFTLVSQEGLFDDKTLGYRQPFAYTFNNTGNYNFTVVGQPRMNVSISVAAS